MSSSRVRSALARGDLADVRTCLGQNLSVPGKVITGKGRGRTIGVPTANLEIWDERAYPANGVYAVFAWAKAAGIRQLQTWAYAPHLNRKPARSQLKRIY